jgi:hypothetical protein
VSRPSADEKSVDRGRRRLALGWAGFLLLWYGAAYAIVLPVTFLGCYFENSELDEGSPKETYCDGIHDLLNSGEPSEWMTPIPYLLVLAALAALGGYGIWRRDGRAVQRAALIGTAALILRVVLVALLPG